MSSSISRSEWDENEDEDVRERSRQIHWNEKRYAGNATDYMRRWRDKYDEDSERRKEELNTLHYSSRKAYFVDVAYVKIHSLWYQRTKNLILNSRGSYSPLSPSPSLLTPVVSTSPIGRRTEGRFLVLRERLSACSLKITKVEPLPLRREGSPIIEFPIPIYLFEAPWIPSLREGEPIAYPVRSLRLPSSQLSTNIKIRSGRIVKR
ncbi:hypothetical protein HZH68_004745 [Vespula germanica]|uniref:Uncharacterized protein n=1 Tax=Vespula germanica TaxID=30212 RepID=A0A834KLY5_VESGE|nr:hypothetical protein HZH68_004745 [Vespula germanica]